MLRPTPPGSCFTLPGTEPPGRTSALVLGAAWMSSTQPPMTTKDWAAMCLARLPSGVPGLQRGCAD
jgi:hypothetical protein